MAYCFQLDCLIIASQEPSITVWGPDWEPHGSFLGHTDVVNSLFYWPELNMLVSSSADCTIRIWDVEECKAVQCVHTDPKNPPLHIGSKRKGDTLFSVSHEGVDFWTVRSLYTLCSKFREDERATLRQIVISYLPAPHPTRVLCISGDNYIYLVAAETGAVLTFFKAKDRILCADYCIHKEILLALTEAGTVLKANTLTNPIALMQEWKDRSQGPLKRDHHVKENDVQTLLVPGPACCLVLYSCIADTQKALEDWESLQVWRGCSQRKDREIDDVKNKFLVFIGQSGGCVSVLNINNGNVLCRMLAHNGQKVTTMQVDPEKNILLSTGEDLTLVVWRVHPYAKECLTQQLSLQCGQPQVYLAALGSHLAQTGHGFSSHSLKFFSLLDQKQADYQPREEHSDCFTGLCVIPEMNLFVSSSLDKTLCFWNDENHLIRTLHLQAVPDSLAYSVLRGELFLGIKGNLHKMKCAKYLPRDYQDMLHNTCIQPLPDVPIPVNEEQTDTSKQSEAATSKQLLTGGKQEQKYFVAINNDLEALLKGTVKHRKEPPPSTRQTRKDAFDCYMNMIYDLPPECKIGWKDVFDSGNHSFYDNSKCTRPYKFPKLKEVNSSQPIADVPVKLKKTKQRETLPTLKEAIQQPAEKLPLKKVVTVEKVIRVEETEEIKPQRIITPKEQPQPKPVPLPLPPPPPPPPPQLTIPSFLEQFAEMEWFNDIFRDKKNIPNNLTAENFCLKLLSYQQTCSRTSKRKILTAIQALHSQGLLPNTDEVYKRLVSNLPKCVTPHMSALERAVVKEMLKLLLRLKSEISYELMKKLLTLLAYEELGLWKIVLGLLVASGVDEAEQWLWPEVQTWNSELQDRSNTWNSIHGKADCWLELWCSKFKSHNLRSTAKWNIPNFSVVDVLNYFCYVQKEVTNVPAAHQDERMIQPMRDGSSKPIIRLTETNSMNRIRKPPGIVLPPMIKRPSLMDFPNFITLPLPRVTLSLFHNYREEAGLKELASRYFIHEQSWVEYYRG